jgi:uncharacterized protein YaaR (DUF327 family)
MKEFQDIVLRLQTNPEKIFLQIDKNGNVLVGGEELTSIEQFKEAAKEFAETTWESISEQKKKMKEMGNWNV